MIDPTVRARRRPLPWPATRRARTTAATAAARSPCCTDRAVPDRVHVRTFLGDDPTVLAQCGHDAPTAPRVDPSPANGPGAVMTARSSMITTMRQVVTLADLEVVRVVRRRDLDRAGAERRVDVFVGDDRDVPVGQRQRDGPCRPGARSARRRDEPPRQCRRAWFRLAWWPRRRSRSPVAVSDRDKFTVIVGVVDLDVGERGEVARAPVDDSFRAIDQVVVVEALEDRLDGARETFVEREASRESSRRRRRADASGRGSCRRTPLSTPRSWRGTPRGCSRNGPCPRFPPGAARPGSAPRCWRDPCPGSHSVS